MTDRGSSGGYESATCPTCGKTFTWTVIRKPHVIMQCTNEIMNPDNKKASRCPQKFTRSEWAYIGQRQREGKPIPQ